MPNKVAIDIKDVSFSYGSKKILENFNLTIESGKIYCLIGSSGSGKTTTLRLINGLLKPDQGSIILDGKALDFSQAEKARRHMGYSIQGSGLFPHMTLYENLSIIARKEKWSSEQVSQRVQELCDLMSLPSDPVFLAKKPREISGGQQQRVGIARALFMNPKIMLMDEPFSALDPITRVELQKEFLNLQKKLHITIVIVTHDLSEAFSMAHEIVLLNDGRIEQKDGPSKFLLSPASQYVRNFIQSHSPGNRLKEVFLYSVVNPNVWVTQKGGSSFLAKHLDTKEVVEFQSQEKCQKFLEEKRQKGFYWVDHNSVFLCFEDFMGKTHVEMLPSTENILKGMRELLAAQSSSLPIVNEAREMIGVFSQEALNVI